MDDLTKAVNIMMHHVSSIGGPLKSTDQVAIALATGTP